MLTFERFQELAEAFGGDIGCWPEAERSAALTFAGAEPAATASILRQAAVLDRLLDASPAPAASVALRDAIIAAAPRPRGFRMGRRWAGVGLGAGLAAASVAGILTGAAAAPIAASHIRMHAADTAGEAARWLGEPADVTEG